MTDQLLSQTTSSAVEIARLQTALAGCNDDKQRLGEAFRHTARLAIELRAITRLIGSWDGTASAAFRLLSTLRDRREQTTLPVLRRIEPAQWEHFQEVAGER